MKTKITFIIIAFTTICNAQIINIPDSNFKAKLLQASPFNEIASIENPIYDISNNSITISNYSTIDTNGDGEIQISEAVMIKYLNLSQIIVSSNITSLVGIEYFTNLQYLNCTNNELNILNVSACNNLKFLFCAINNLDSLDISENSNLIELNCASNNLTSLNTSENFDLLHLNCQENNILSLNLSQNVNLTSLYCNANQLTSLNVSQNNSLSTIVCGNNQITNLDITNTNVNLLDINNNFMTELYLKNNNFGWYSIDLDNNIQLTYVCVKDEDVDFFEQYINELGYTNCHINTYCSFTPGGTFYTIQGNNKFDFNVNGCDINDIVYPNFKFSITDGTNTGIFITNNSGNYSIPLQSGTHTATPIIENPTYFNVSPTSINVSFPSTSSPFTQDFCISPNGSHNDLEVLLLPINAASPGFDAIYKLVYKNKGTTTQSGTINFSFDDSVLDFVSSNPSFTSQSTGNLTWDFTNLLPFESREIDIVLNLNSPTETPALNSGDLLNFTASVNSSTDETPNDNIATLNQIVVNSYDPNDKTCLEGTTITPTMVGEYVHYLIRFENNGTANAQNIVVKDMIDINKFDINTLIPIKGSHNFETRISNTNKVEFIFQNINLPFDDANNDGYISFKIKTKSNLVVGNTFSNSANIYFDYNFPIVTNNYTTTVQNSLGIQENDYINDISVYPNPVKDILNFKTEQNILKVEVYDIAGRILSSNSISENKIDLSELKTGNYILKLFTEKGIMNTKIIKE